MANIPRTISKDILDALDFMPVVFVNGPRQAGKSTLVQAIAASKWPATYITFDEPSQLGAAQANPEIFLRSHAENLILDEVQMVPELYRIIKMIVDERRFENKRKGHFLLTGSANLMALPALADALVGRMSIITLYPLSAVEISKSKTAFLERLFGNKFHMEKRQDKEDIVNIIRRSLFRKSLMKTRRCVISGLRTI